MKDIPTQRGRHYIQQLVAEGEHEQQDFKFLISDARKIARSISAFANNSGGRLLIGVKDNGRIAGVRNEEDIFMVEQAAERYCLPAQQVDFHAFSVDTGVVVIRASIARANERPVSVVEADGALKAYYRVADENIVAPDLMVRSWQRRDSAAGSVCSTGCSIESEVLALLECRPQGISPREIALTLHRSVAATDEALVSLTAMGLARFVFDGITFRVAHG